jgi:hypothetical protein
MASAETRRFGKKTKAFSKNATVSDIQYESWMKIIFFINMACAAIASARAAHTSSSWYMKVKVKPASERESEVRRWPFYN